MIVGAFTLEVVLAGASVGLFLFAIAAFALALCQAAATGDRIGAAAREVEERRIAAGSGFRVERRDVETR